MNGQNFYRLTSTYQSWYSIASSSPYSANVYRLEAKCNVSNNSSGTANIVYIRVRFIGGYVDPGDHPLDSPRTNDEIDGTFAVTVGPGTLWRRKAICLGQLALYLQGQYDRNASGKTGLNT